MKKLFTALIALLSLVSFNANATTVVLYAEGANTSDLPEGTAVKVTSTNFKTKTDNEINEAFYANPTAIMFTSGQIRIFGTNSITFTPKEGVSFNSITFAYAETPGAQITADSGTLTTSDDQAVWKPASGSANSKVMFSGGQSGSFTKFKYIKIDYTAGSVEQKQTPTWTFAANKNEFSINSTVNLSNWLTITDDAEKDLIFTYYVAMPGSSAQAIGTSEYTFPNVTGKYIFYVESAKTATYESKKSENVEVTVVSGQVPTWDFNPEAPTLAVGDSYVLTNLLNIPQAEESLTFSFKLECEGADDVTISKGESYTFTSGGTYKFIVTSEANDTYAAKTISVELTVEKRTPGWTLTAPEKVFNPGESFVPSSLVTKPEGENLTLIYKMKTPGAATAQVIRADEAYIFGNPGNYTLTVSSDATTEYSAKNSEIIIEVVTEKSDPTWTLKQASITTVGEGLTPANLVNISEAEQAVLTLTYSITAPDATESEVISGVVNYAFPKPGEYTLTVTSDETAAYNAATRTCKITAVYGSKGTFTFTTIPSYGMDAKSGSEYETTVKRIELTDVPGMSMDLTGQYRMMQSGASIGLYIMPGATFTINMPEGTIEKITVKGSMLGGLTVKDENVTNNGGTEIVLIPSAPQKGATYTFTNSGSSTYMRISTIVVGYDKKPDLEMSLFADGTSKAWSKTITVSNGSDRFYAEEGNGNIELSIAKAEDADFYVPTEGQLSAIAANGLSDKLTEWDSYFYEDASCSAEFNEDATAINISVPCSGKYIVTLKTIGTTYAPATKTATLNVYPSYDGLRFNWQPANLDKNMACITNPVQGSDGHTYNEKNCRIGVNAFFYQLYYDGTPVVNQEGVDPVSYVAAADSWTAYPASLAPGQGIDLSGFNSLSVKIAKNGVETPAAEVKAITFGTNEEVGVDGIESDANAPAEYYTLSGVRVSGDNLQPGLYILRQGRTVAKVLVK